jgi:hypothetical protein
MTKRSATTIMQLADPAADVPVDHLWADAEGRATHERIIADVAPAPAPRPPRRRRTLIGVGLPGAKHNGAPAAWSVTKNANGTVTVKVTDFRDPDGLQRRMRAAGLRANVRTLADRCTPRIDAQDDLVYLAVWNADSTELFRRLLALPPLPAVPRNGASSSPAHPRRPATVTIDPRQLPAGDTIWVGFPPHGVPTAGHQMRLSVNPTDHPSSCFSR